MPATKNPTPNPKRVAAGRRNWKLRKPLSAETKDRLREAAHKNKPWLKSTGPRTAAGKAKVALNGTWRQKELLSARQLRAELAAARSTIKRIRRLRDKLVEASDSTC